MDRKVMSGLTFIFIHNKRLLSLHAGRILNRIWSNEAIEGAFDFAREITHVCFRQISSIFWSNYMFNNTLKILFAVSFMVLGSFTAANAQLGNGNAIRVTVDHPFVVEDKTFPAGKYTIATIGDFDGSDSILKLQSLNGKEFVAFQTIGEELNEPAKSTELIFDRLGDEYILSKIRIAGDIEGTEVEKTRSEKAALAAAAVN